jgi:hypothetical protein
MLLQDQSTMRVEDQIGRREFAIPALCSAGGSLT